MIHRSSCFKLEATSAGVGLGQTHDYIFHMGGVECSAVYCTLVGLVSFPVHIIISENRNAKHNVYIYKGYRNELTLEMKTCTYSSDSEKESNFYSNCCLIFLYLLPCVHTFLLKTSW